jgi:hypothetical protein
VDDRAVDWLYLLPPDSRFVADRVPSAFHDVLGSRLSRAGHSYLGWDSDSRILDTLPRYESAVLVNPRGLAHADLESIGFRETQVFSALPSLGEARWLIPTAPSRVAARALDVYAAHRRTAKLKKQLVSVLARLGQIHRLGDRLILARRRKTLLEEEAERVTHGAPVLLALSTGTPQEHRKPTIQMMTADGQIVAYGKLATSEPARAALGREIGWLRALAGHDSLVDALPHLLAVIEASESLGSLQTPGPSGSAPTAFGRAHQAFLTALALATRRSMPFQRSAMWRNMAASFAALEPRLEPLWRTRLLSAMQRLVVELGPVELDLATAHGDFRPRNHRLRRNGRLFVFDWELAQPEMIPCYDLFHFCVEGHAVFGDRDRDDEIVSIALDACRRWEPAWSRRPIRHLFLAYVVDRAMVRLRNGLRRQSDSQDRQLTLIGTVLDHHAAWLPAGAAPASSA